MAFLCAFGDFRSGEDVVLSLNDNYAIGVGDTNLNPGLPESIWSKVVELCSSIRQHTRANAP